MRVSYPLLYLFPLGGAAASFVTASNASIAEYSELRARQQYVPKCSCPLVNSRACTGQYQCQCQNEQYMKCWKQNRNECEVPFRECMSNGQPTLPTYLDGEFPPCGRGLPACRQNSICTQISRLCIPWNSDCMGICLPGLAGGNNPTNNAVPQLAMKPKPAAVAPQPPPPAAPVAAAPGSKPTGFVPQPGNSACPANWLCPGQDDLCLNDPRQKGPTPVYICGYPQSYCGGTEKRVCASNEICVADPRESCALTLDGNSCQGICV